MSEDVVGPGVTPNAQASLNLGNIGSSLTIALQNQTGVIYRVTANTASATVSFSGVQPGAQWIVQHTQDATGSRRTVFSGVTWVTGAGAVNPTANAVDVFNFYSPDGTVIYGFQASSPYYVPTFQNSISTVLETMPREVAMNARGLTAGTIMCTHFTPDRDIVVSNIETITAGTLAVGATLAKMAITQVGGTAGATTHTTIARTASDTTLWTAIAYYSRAIVDDGQSNSISSVLLKAGVRYAACALTVGNSTAPQLAGPAGAGQGSLMGSDISGRLPRMSSQLSAQTDIPGSFSTGSTGSGSQLWVAMY